MKTISFDQLPDAVAELGLKVDYLTTLLLARNSNIQSPVSPNSPDLLTIKEAAELVNLAVPTLYGLVGRNEIPHMKPGKKLYFSRTELLAWIQQGRRKTKAEVVGEVHADLMEKGQHDE